MSANGLESKELEEKLKQIKKECEARATEIAST